jgi:hypothetical protein
MDDQRTDRTGGRILALDSWLPYVCIVGLVLGSLDHGIHAWDGHSLWHTAMAVVEIVAAVLILKQIVRRWHFKKY